MTKNKTKRRCLLALLALFLFACDFFSKYWVTHHIPNMSYSSPFYPYGGIGIFQDFLGIDFCINSVTNKGGAWGVFASYPQVLLIARMIIIALVLIYALFFNRDRSRQIPFLLILTGAIGNIFDCFYYGHVVDMFHFILWGYSYPVFNVADSLIFLGVTSMIILSLRQKLKRKRYEHSDQPSQG